MFAGMDRDEIPDRSTKDGLEDIDECRGLVYSANEVSRAGTDL